MRVLNPEKTAYSICERESHLNSRGWRLVRKIAFMMTKGRCALNPLHRASHLHHLYYKRFWLERIFFGVFYKMPFDKCVLGLEVIGLNCVPLCGHCHGVSFNPGDSQRYPGSVHHKSHWVSHKDNPIENHQKFWFALRLLVQFWAIALWPGWFFALAVFIQLGLIFHLIYPWLVTG